jgi:SAM-dependent methyltransferase
MPADWLGRARAFYDRDPEAEWGRLDGRVQYRIERLVTWHALERHLPPPGEGVHVLDAGGGPGRYTIELAARGYRVTLLDLSPGNIALARRKIGEAAPSVAANVADCVQASFTDLSRYADGAFDAVLCLGAALSHVVDAAARSRALTELRRVARPGAPVLVSALNRLAVYRGLVQWPYSWDEFGDGAGLARFAHSGDSEGTERSPWPSHSYLPEEFRAALADAGLAAERLYGAQGIAAHLPPENLEALMEDADRWPVWRQLLLATCDEPSLVGVSAHLLAVARRGYT